MSNSSARRVIVSALGEQSSIQIYETWCKPRSLTWWETVTLNDPKKLALFMLTTLNIMSGPGLCSTSLGHSSFRTQHKYRTNIRKSQHLLNTQQLFLHVVGSSHEYGVPNLSQDDDKKARHAEISPFSAR